MVVIGPEAFKTSDSGDLRVKDLRFSLQRFSLRRFSILRWPNLRWPNLRWPNLRWLNLRWPNLVPPAIRRCGIAIVRATALCALCAGATFAQAAPQASLPTPPSAERVRSGMYDASDPPALLRFMEKTGYHVELGADAQGDPLIKGRISRSDYLIQFYECEHAAFCNSVQFLAQAPKPAGLTLDQVNAFNLRWRYVRLTVSEAQVRIQMDVNLDAGVTGDNFEDTLDIWRQLLETFERDVLRLS